VTEFGAIATLYVVMGLFSVAVIGLSIWVAVDAGSLPEWAFQRAGTSKSLWIALPLAGSATCGIVTVVAAVVWFSTYKRRVVAGRDAVAQPQAFTPGWPPPASW
jgi:hypothetical protein